MFLFSCGKARGCHESGQNGMEWNPMNKVTTIEILWLIFIGCTHCRHILLSKTSVGRSHINFNRKNETKWIVKKKTLQNMMLCYMVVMQLQTQWNKPYRIPNTNGQIYWNTTMFNVQWQGQPVILHANVTLLMLLLEYWTVDHEKWKQIQINRKSLLNFFIAPRWICMCYAWQAMRSCPGMNALQTKYYTLLLSIYFEFCILKCFLNVAIWFTRLLCYFVQTCSVLFSPVQFHSAKWIL